MYEFDLNDFVYMLARVYLCSGCLFNVYVLLHRIDVVFVFNLVVSLFSKYKNVDYNKLVTR